MLDNLYLIAHSVRGEPAFDIAERVTEGQLAEIEGEYWIIPTSGHRAYPYWHTPIKELNVYCPDDVRRKLEYAVPTMPEDAIDHYWHSGNDEIQRRYDAEEGKSLLERLGLIKPPTPINRRSL